MMECIPNASFADQVESVRREILWLSMSMRYIEENMDVAGELHGQQAHSCGDEIAVSRLDFLSASMCTAQFCADWLHLSSYSNVLNSSW